MKDTDVRQGTLALMVLKTLDVLGPLAWLRDRPAHRADQRGSADRQSGDSLPGAAQAGAGRVYRVRMGSVREQPQGALLSADTARPQAIAGRSPELGTDGGDHRAILRRESAGPEMKTLRRLFQRLTSWATSARDEELLRAEFEEHIAMQTAENLRAGLSPVEARRQALLKFGNVEAIKEIYRDQRGLPFIETLVCDTRHALRRMRKAPAFTAAVIVTLALGIGANTAIFAVIDSILIRPLPYPQAEALVSVWHTAPGLPGLPDSLGCSPSMYFTYREENRIFQQFGVWSSLGASVTGVCRARACLGRSSSPTASWTPWASSLCWAAGFRRRTTRRDRPRRSCSPTATGSAASGATRPSSAGR